MWAQCWNFHGSIRDDKHAYFFLVQLLPRRHWPGLREQHENEPIVVQAPNALRASSPKMLPTYMYFAECRIILPVLHFGFLLHVVRKTRTLLSLLSLCVLSKTKLEWKVRPLQQTTGGKQKRTTQKKKRLSAQNFLSFINRALYSNLT